MAPSDDDQDTPRESAPTFGYERHNRRSAPEPAPDIDLPATDAREDFAADPAPAAAPAAPPAAEAAKDGPEAPEPAPDAPAAPTAVPASLEGFVAYPASPPDHPSRLPPAARPIRQG